jgi:hypothetical protein
MQLPSNLIPDDLRSFLSDPKNRTFQFASEDPLEVEEGTFYASDELELREFKLSTPQYYDNEGTEIGDDPELYYEIPGADLVSETPDYGGDGILIWFPKFHEYGSWDPDHGTILLFPGISWGSIQNNLARYLNAQWYRERVQSYLLRPWVDPRCADIEPHKLFEVD